MKGSHFSARPRRAFTLVELLVVIAIVGVLAAILFPVFATAREKARATDCLSNLKQLGMATMLYVQDYDEQFVNVVEDHEGYAFSPLWPQNDYPMPGGGVYGWYTIKAIVGVMPGVVTDWGILLVDTYSKNQGIFACPDGTSSGIWHGATATDNSGYCYSNWIADTGVFRHPAATLAEIPRPAETVVFFDTGKATRYVEIEGYNGYPGGSTTTFNPHECCPRCWDDWPTLHSGGHQYVWADGHAKWMPDDSMWIFYHPERWDWELQTN
jgi:prepilin-type N-terminal cleavage/methylation domain-containing protein/prepilin-type processing-associated H-X9-DG protein